MSSRPKILLKARPTDEQIFDRLQAPRPEGLEVYLDAVDINGDAWLDHIMGRIESLDLSPSFTWLVEGPIRSLDGSFFDVTVDSAANREVLQRLVTFGSAVGADAACIHLIAPTTVMRCPERGERQAILRQSLPLLRWYAELCQISEIVPTIENIPPVSRMREGRMMTSLVGVLGSDLLWVGEEIEGLRFTLDLSHAQLSVNAQTFGRDGDDHYLSALIESFAQQAEVTDLLDFVGQVSGGIVTVHVSDARGLLGEGLCYGEGDAPLDEAIGRLLSSVSYLVTEVIEPDPNRSANMRAAESRIRAIRESSSSPLSSRGGARQ